MTWIAGTGLTAFGKHPGRGPMDLMAEAAQAALDEAGLVRAEIDGLITGYATTLPHLMLSTAFAESFGLRPAYAHAVQLGGGTGAAMAMLAHRLIQGGAARRILIVAGENRRTGHAPGGAAAALSQVGHPGQETPRGPTLPAYYALLAARYLALTGTPVADLAPLAVLMRRNAAATPGAHLADPITEADVAASPVIASPLRLLDCCPVSDGAAALVLTADRPEGAALRIIGAGQAHLHQHVTEMADAMASGASAAAARATAEAGVRTTDAGYLAIYDSFTITLMMLLEELGLAPRGRAGAMARAGDFDAAGARPLNTHGGLLSYGQCGVAGAMAHLVEMHRQMTRRAGPRQIPAEPALGLMHGDGGVLSSHVTLVLERAA